VHEDKKRLVQIVIREGSSLPLDSAQGQVFLAHHSDRALMESLLSGLPLLERTDLELRVARTREQGLAINSRVTEGIRAIAAPVFDERMKIRATLALVGTLAEIPEEPDSVLAHALMDTAEHVSHDLGASVSPPSSASGQGASPPGQRDEK
jgi:DNA-binding IclR family transcriptional regulator